MNLQIKILTAIGSISSVCFGIWHLFVPKIWGWYNYIDKNAAELIKAVRAVNIFFSVSLILFGVINILFVYTNKSNKYSIAVMLVSTCILWSVRVILQLAYPQGSIKPFLQYGMLSAFIIIFLCYLISLVMIIITK